MSKTLRQNVTFKAPPHIIYEILMDSRQHSKLTGSEAKISRRVGGRFSVFDGEISGLNLELEPDRKIVQSWRYADWPEGVFSRASFTLAITETGTRLTLTQSGIPDDKFEDIKEGWRDYYWEPLKALLKTRLFPTLQS